MYGLTVSASASNPADFFPKLAPPRCALAIRDDDRIYIIGVSGGVTPWNDRVEHFLNDFTPTGSPDKDKRTEPPAKAKNKKNPFKGE